MFVGSAIALVNGSDIINLLLVLGSAVAISLSISTLDLMPQEFHLLEASPFPPAIN